jgi:hypothetical protein
MVALLLQLLLYSKATEPLPAKAYRNSYQVSYSSCSHPRAFAARFGEPGQQKIWQQLEHAATTQGTQTMPIAINNHTSNANSVDAVFSRRLFLMPVEPI